MMIVAVLLGVVVSFAVWAVRGRTAWWVPAFAFSFLGGYIDVGFKIYCHEIGVGLSLIGAAWLIADRPRRPEGRPPLDWSVYALAAYILGHMAVSCYSAMAGRLPGTGTIVRLYVNGLWGLVFAAVFWRYGDLRHFRVALSWATVFGVIRIALGVFSIYTPLPAADRANPWLYASSSGADLRASAPALMALLTIWFYQRREGIARVVLLAVYVAAIWLTLLGASRVAALSVFVIPCIWALVQRRGAALLGYSAAVAALIVAINVSPGFFRGLPDGARRALSTFVVVHYSEERGTTAGGATAGTTIAGGTTAGTTTAGTTTAGGTTAGTTTAGTTTAGGTTAGGTTAGRDIAGRETSSSDDWHVRLLQAGWRRWTADLASFTFGNRLEGWRQEYAKASSVEEMVDVAVRLAAYESAFFTITATLGVIGLLLFVRVMYWLYRPFAGDILRHGIRHQDDALAFVAVQGLILYVALCWIAGGYPSAQIVLGSLAAASVYDRSGALALGGSESPG